MKLHAGVDIVEADVAKGILTVTGAADPYEIIRRTRKTGKCVEVVSIGPPSAPPKPTDPKPTDQKKPEEKKPQPEKKPPEKKQDEKKPDQKAQTQNQPQLQLQPFVPRPYMGNNYPPQYMGQNYPTCDRVAVVYIGRQDEPSPACNIM